MRIALFLFLCGFILLDGGTARAALREAECIVTRNKVTTTTAKDYASFRSCLRATTYEENYVKQCDASARKGEYFGKSANCMYHSVANFFCSLREPGSEGAAKLCYDAHAYYGRCVFYNAPGRPELAASDFPKFLSCVRGTPFHKDADMRCTTPETAKKQGGYNACLKWEFVYAFCNLSYNSKAERDVCYGSYQQFIRSESSTSVAPSVKDGKSPIRKAGTPYGDGSSYVWTAAPKRNPSRAQKGYREPKRKVDPRNTYAYYTARAIASQAAALQKKIDAYKQQQAESVDGGKIVVKNNPRNTQSQIPRTR